MLVKSILFAQERDYSKLGLLHLGHWFSTFCILGPPTGSFWQKKLQSHRSKNKSYRLQYFLQFLLFSIVLIINGNSYFRDLTSHPSDRQIKPVVRVPLVHKHCIKARNKPLCFLKYSEGNIRSNSVFTKLNRMIQIMNNTHFTISTMYSYWHLLVKAGTKKCICNFIWGNLKAERSIMIAIHILIYDLFNDAVSSSVYIASNDDKWNVN
jgi:hypothetical protein